MTFILSLDLKTSCLTFIFRYERARLITISSLAFVWKPNKELGIIVQEMSSINNDPNELVYEKFYSLALRRSQSVSLY